MYTLQGSRCYSTEGWVLEYVSTCMHMSCLDKGALQPTTHSSLVRLRSPYGAEGRGLAICSVGHQLEAPRSKYDPQQLHSCLPPSPCIDYSFLDKASILVCSGSRSWAHPIQLPRTRPTRRPSRQTLSRWTAPLVSARLPFAVARTCGRFPFFSPFSDKSYGWTA